MANTVDLLRLLLVSYKNIPGSNYSFSLIDITSAYFSKTIIIIIITNDKFILP